MPDVGKLILVSLMVLCLNLPFGYWRANVDRFGLQWFLAIHIPVPFIILLRYLLHTGWHWSTFLFFISSFFFGQYIGGYLHRRHALYHPGNTSSCLFTDLFRDIRQS